jgi:hypothetical protein
MPIRMFGFSEGLRLPNGEAAGEHLGRLAVRCSDESVILRPGEYNLTPFTWERSPVRQRLLVHDENLATFQRLSRIGNPVVRELFGGDELLPEDDFVIGHSLLPEDTKYVGVLSPSGDGRGQEVWDIIYHVKAEKDFREQMALQSLAG